MFQRSDTPATLAGVDACRSFFGGCMDAGTGDALWVAHVDANVRCIDLTSYEDSSAGLPVRAILTRAAELGSAGVALAQRTPRSSSGEALYAPQRPRSSPVPRKPWT